MFPENGINTMPTPEAIMTRMMTDATSLLLRPAASYRMEKYFSIINYEMRIIIHILYGKEKVQVQGAAKPV
jgi:hypothetical protein